MLKILMNKTMKIATYECLLSVCPPGNIKSVAAYS